MKGQGFLKNFKNFLWPGRCVFCQRVIPEGRQVCPACEKKNSSAGLRYYIFNGSQSRCFACLSVYPFTSSVRQAIYRFKFRDKPGYAAFFGKQMAEVVENFEKAEEFDAVTCVPLSLKRQRERGYNQSQLLAEEMAAALSLPYEPTLVKVKENREQHKLKAGERKGNVLGVYSVIGNPAGKRYLLVDDIITTGNTVSECGRMLKRAGAKQVVCVSAARVF